MDRHKNLRTKGVVNNENNEPLSRGSTRLKNISESHHSTSNILTDSYNHTQQAVRPTFTEQNSLQESRGAYSACDRPSGQKHTIGVHITNRTENNERMGLARGETEVLYRGIFAQYL
jgi:hypothetical protein